MTVYVLPHLLIFGDEGFCQKARNDQTAQIGSGCFKGYPSRPASQTKH